MVNLTNNRIELEVLGQSLDYGVQNCHFNTVTFLVFFLFVHRNLILYDSLYIV